MALSGLSCRTAAAAVLLCTMLACSAPAFARSPARKSHSHYPAGKSPKRSKQPAGAHSPAKSTHPLPHASHVSPKKRLPHAKKPKSPKPKSRLSPKKKLPTSPPKKAPRASPKSLPTSPPRKAANRTATCFPGNYNNCKDPRTAGLLRAAGNNVAGPDVVPIQLPNDGSVLTINNDQAYYLAGDYTQDYLAVNGRLYCGPPGGPQVPITLTVRALLVAGVFQCGTAVAPYTAQVNITLTGAGGVDGSKSIMVAGNISWHGAPRSTWTTLSTTILNGTNSFNTKDPVDWAPGETIVITATGYNSSEYEEMVIATAQPSGDGGTTITTTTNFVYNHWGELQTFTAPSGRVWTLDERGQVALLTRNIVIQGDAASEDVRIGGQLTVSLGGNAWVKNVMFYRMGEAGRLGSYPMHWHLLGDRTGNFIIGSVLWKSWNRCVTIHSTDNVLVERNVCHDSIGHGYFMEDGCETGNKYRYNLAMTIRLPPTKEQGTVDTDTDRLSAFWITNPFNNYIGNVAAGSQFAGFWMVTPSSPVNKCLQPDQKPDITPDSMSLGVYDHNMAHSNQVGFAIEDGVCSGDRSPLCFSFYKPPGLPRTITNLTLTKNSHTQRTIWITVQARIDFKGCTFAGGRGTLFSGKQIISDSLFVGQSNNLTGTIGSVNWGFGFYDGPAGLKDSYFTRYLTNSYTCLAPVGSAYKGWPAFIQGVEFDPAISRRSKLLMRGNYSVGEFSSQAFIDVDGSLSGVAGGALLVPWLNDSAAYLPAPGRNSRDFYAGAGCTVDLLWRVYICPPNQKLANIRLRHNYIISGPGAVPRIVDIFRSDGKRLTIDNNLGIRPWNQFNVILNQNFTYNVKYRDENSLMWDDPNTPTSFYVDLNNADVDDTTTITLSNLPIGSWQWSVFDCLTDTVITPPSSDGTVTMTLTAVNQNTGGPYPNLKAGGRTVYVCKVFDCYC